MTILAILEGLAFFVVLPVIIGLIIISLVMIFERNKQQMPGNIKEAIGNMVCSIDADCPTGHVCIDGKCVPQSELNRPFSPA